MSDNILIGIFAAIVAAVLIFVSVLLGTACGALTGYILSMVFLGDWIVQGFKIFEINASGNLVVIGALFGFMSGFFKTSVSTK